ncbi:MAG: hypothetical protein HC825_03395 [Oscillatoriales cyanobacterium RM1_1_9]|nr:hypothetical protein [Oscillatoriales cyanobacterium SM2_3_0]NJO47311.1 hypothetical protein [Oscillatoriales cyanobacterium RM2_1_1]NJO70997.1 hypothetical protein [Oscillatoriales cyanobacterium RM1_1_9]
MFDMELLPGAINEILVSVSQTQTLNETDRYGLMAAILDEDLPEEDCLSINRLLRAVIRGRVQVNYSNPSEPDLP